MLRYNTQMKPLRLPEYGRNIQKMVDFCLTIEDRQERTDCAFAIVKSMANLFPELKSNGQYSHKLWDHLAIMSDFRLDIDYPVEVVQQENLTSRPAPIPYKDNELRRRHYGRTILSMIDVAAGMEEGPERDALIALVANQMKKLLIETNRDGVDDRRVFNDLRELSQGRIFLDPATLRLNDYIIPVQTSGKKKKKK
ncbi:MAG: DUF4290 domain-containing protein [Paramuribaculum sp.]|nr:DUF4290 domain-containing protein [Paramuribaculum sp.]